MAERLRDELKEREESLTEFCYFCIVNLVSVLWIYNWLCKHWKVFILNEVIVGVGRLVLSLRVLIAIRYKHLMSFTLNG